MYQKMENLLYNYQDFKKVVEEKQMLRDLKS